MTNELKKSHKKSRWILLLILFSFFMYFYPKYAEKRHRIAEEKRIAALKYEAEAKECLAEKARVEAEKARRKLLAEQAAEKARLLALRVKVVTDFYQAINDHDCTKAIELRPSYNKERCLNIKSATIKTAKIVRETPTISVVYLKMVYRQKGKRRSNSFSGHLQLVKQDEQWLIAGYYDSQSSLEEYLKKHNIPPTTSSDKQTSQ